MKIGRHVGKHAEYAHGIVDPATIRDRPVRSLVPDREGQMDCADADRDVDP